MWARVKCLVKNFQQAGVRVVGEGQAENSGAFLAAPSSMLSLASFLQEAQNGQQEMSRAVHLANPECLHHKSS